MKFYSFLQFSSKNRDSILLITLKAALKILFMFRSLSYIAVFCLGLAVGSLSVIYIPGVREKVISLFKQSSNKVIETVKSSSQEIGNLLSQDDSGKSKPDTKTE